MSCLPTESNERYDEQSSRVGTCGTRGTRGLREGRGAARSGGLAGLRHSAARKFAAMIAGRPGTDILALWERYGDELDERCAGAALRSIAKDLGAGSDWEARSPGLDRLIWRILDREPHTGL